MTKQQILFIDDELPWSNYIIEHLKNAFDVILVSDIQSALSVLKGNPEIRAVITDLAIKVNQKSNSPFGLDMITAIRRQRTDVPIIAYAPASLNGIFPDLYLGVDLVINKTEILREDFVDKVKMIIHSHVKLSSINKREETSLSSETRKVIMEELEKYTHIKERTISLPEEGNYELIKPLIGFKRDIEKQLAKFEFSKNVFLMMKFRPQNKDLSDFIIENLAKNGFNGIRADANEWNITHNVYNPIAVLYCCKYGIALFDEPEHGQAYSPNVAYELGIMHTQNKNCLMLRHSSLPQVPFDLIKDIYMTYEKDLEVKRLTNNWLMQIKM